MNLYTYNIYIYILARANSTASFETLSNNDFIFVLFCFVLLSQHNILFYKTRSTKLCEGVAFE